MEVKNKVYCTDADSVLGMLESLSQRLTKLEEMQNAMLTMPNVVWRKYHHTPHKCPVCDGNGRVNLDKPLVKENATYFSISCVPCKEEGIVWG